MCVEHHSKPLALGSGGESRGNQNKWKGGKKRNKLKEKYRKGDISFHFMRILPLTGRDRRGLWVIETKRFNLAPWREVIKLSHLSRMRTILSGAIAALLLWDDLRGWVRVDARAFLRVSLVPWPPPFSRSLVAGPLL